MKYTLMWTCLLGPDRRMSNVPFERYSFLVGNTLLEGIFHQNCTRVLRKIRSHVIATFKEIYFNIAKASCATKNLKIEQGVQSQET